MFHDERVAETNCGGNGLRALHAVNDPFDDRSQPCQGYSCYVIQGVDYADWYSCFFLSSSDLLLAVFFRRYRLPGLYAFSISIIAYFVFISGTVHT